MNKSSRTADAKVEEWTSLNPYGISSPGNIEIRKPFMITVFLFYLMWWCICDSKLQALFLLPSYNWHGRNDFNNVMTAAQYSCLQRKLTVLVEDRLHVEDGHWLILSSTTDVVDVIMAPKSDENIISSIEMPLLLLFNEFGWQIKNLRIILKTCYALHHSWVMKGGRSAHQTPSRASWSRMFVASLNLSSSSPPIEGLLDGCLAFKVWISSILLLAFTV